MKKILLFFFSLIAYLLSPFYSDAHAAENFTTAYNVTYTIDEAGIAHVTMRVGLTNTSSQFYASSYKIHVGFDEITNVKASDPKGQLIPKLEKSEDGYTIGVTFKDRVVGKGNTLPLTLTFDTREIAQKRGTIWSINIPGIADQKEFSDFQVTLAVPPSFGRPTYVKPKQASNSLTFTKEQLGEGGISLAFGEKQGYEFHLTYHLSNNNVFPIKTEIALPPSTNYQDVYYSSIEPEPVNVVQDKDGNWLAEYHLKPSQKIDVIARGKAQLSLMPKKEVLSAAARTEYVKHQEYWQISDKEIQRLAKEYTTPEEIYEYVVRQLEYDFSRVTENKPRLGAATVLQRPTSAVCLEFTDLFIALARAAGIPAREVNGYAYTQNDRQRPLSLVKDILHAWPEYYDQERQTWVMVDPTWGNTTGGIDYFHVLDFDHFAFVRKGMSSTYPIPAGGYKEGAEESGKDVHIEFGRIEESPMARITMISGFQDEYMSLLPVSGTVRIRNVSQGLIAPQSVIVSSGTLMPAEQKIAIGAIPPNGVIEVPISFDTQPILTNETHTFTIQVGGNRLDQTIRVVPFLVPNGKIIGGIVFAILSGVLLIIAVRSWRLPFFRRK